KIVLIGMTLLFVACEQQAVRDTEEDISKIKALSAARAKAFNEGDANIIAMAFTDDGLLMAPGTKSTTGRDAVRAYYQGIFDQYKTFLESGYEDVDISGDLAYGVGFARVKLVP